MRGAGARDIGYRLGGCEGGLLSAGGGAGGDVPDGLACGGVFDWSIFPICISATSMPS
jgi:hypothetical protein